MNSNILLSMLKADFLERTRRTSFLLTVSMVIFLGYSVNSGQILVKLDTYRGIYNSAWVGSLMALVITFFLGIAGFYLVKNTVERDERTGVGQILATTPLTRPQYLLGKWLSNFAVLTALVAVLAFAAILMQVLQREEAQIELWALTAPFLFVALPMMALVAALAVFFETIPWLKGGFGNLVYFFVFMALFVGGIFLTQAPWLDVTGVSLIGSSMKAAARAAFPEYRGGFVLAMVSDPALETFRWSGVDWTAGIVLQRMLWLAISAGLVLVGSLFFHRFDPNLRSISLRKPKRSERLEQQEEITAESAALPIVRKITRLTPLAGERCFRMNIFRLVWLEFLLLVKGLKWYWLVGMAVLWIGSVIAPSESLRKYWYMLIVIWPVLVWSRMGERDARYHTEQLISQAAYPLVRLVLSSWLAGVLFTAAMTSGVLVGRLFSVEPIGLVPWALSVLFIPTMALVLGAWSKSSKMFEVIYPILWYLGPFNRENGLAVLDYLGIHAQAPLNTAPLLFAGFVLLLLLAAFLGRRRTLA